MSRLRVNEIEPIVGTQVSVGAQPDSDPSVLLNVQSTTQGFALPRMTTVQRDAIPSPSEGLLIYNTDDHRLEQYSSGSWTVAGNGQSPVMNVLRVVKNPVLNSGDFSSIATAVASISGASATNPYLVQVGPGLYTEPQINLPPFVFVTGLTMDAVYVQPDNSAHHIFTLSTSSGINFLSLIGAGPGYAAVFCNDSGDFTLMHKVTIANCDIGVWFRSETRDCFNYIEYVDSTGGRTGIKIEANSGRICYVNAENFYVYTSDPGNVNPDDGAIVTGTGAQFVCHAAGFEGGANTHGNAVRINDGALVDIKATSFRYWLNGLNVENVGSGCDLNITGCNYLHNTVDINIAGPNTIGVVDAIAIEENCVFDFGTVGNLSIFLSDPDGELVTGGTIKSRQPDGSFTDITTLTSQSSPMGILSSGDINPPAFGFPFTVTAEAGFGYLQKIDGTIKKITWPNTPTTIPANSVRYLYFDSNSVLQQGASLPDITQNIVLGRAVTDSIGIIALDESGFLSTHASSGIGTALRNGLGAIYASGSTVTEFGTRELAITSGEYYYGERQFLAQGGSPITFTTFYQNGIGGFNSLHSQTTIDNAQYDNNGTLTPLTSGYYAKHSVYALGDSTGDFDSEAYFVVYSQAQYSALTLAEQGSLPNPPSYLSESITLIASIIVQQSVTHFTEILDERPLFSAKRVATVSATTFHHNLQGLNDFDDHLKYLPVDGSRPMTGNLPMGTYNVTNAGTYNGVTVENHHARHQPGSGLDELPTAAAVTLTPNLANATGTSTSLSRADHVHNVPTAAPATQGPDNANADGVATTFSKSDHVHNIPTAAASSLNANSTDTQGVSTSFARADHTHAIASGLPSTQTPNQPNATGTSVNFARADHIHDIPTVAPVSQTPNNANADGVAATFSRSDHVHNIPTAAPATQGPDNANADGVAATFSRADHVHDIPTDVPIQVNANGSNVKGVSTSFSRADHKHDILTGTPSALTPNLTNNAGSSSALARADHIHNVPTAAPITQGPDNINADGVATTFSKSDHVHDIPTAVPVTLNPDVSNTRGTSTSFARADHIHDVPTAAAVTQTPNQSNAQGTSTSFARADHVHNIPTAAPVTQTPDNVNADGSAATFSRSDHVHDIATDVPIQANANGSNVKGTSTSFARADHKHDILIGTPVSQTPDQANANGSSSALSRADHVHNIPTAIAVDVATANAQGSAATFSRADHAHKGVHSVKAGLAGTQRFGDLSIDPGNGTSVTDDGSGNFTVDTLFGPNEFVITSTSGLVINYTGGRFINGLSGNTVNVPAGSITAPANLNPGYLYVSINALSSTPTVNASSTPPPTDSMPIASFVSGPSTITSTTDARSFVNINPLGNTMRITYPGTGLVVNYNAGRVRINGVATNISDGTLTLTANTALGAIYVDTDNTIKSNNTGTFTPNCVPLATFTTGPSSVTALSGQRTFLNNYVVFGANSDIQNLTPNLSAAAGSTNKYADAGHIHNVPTAAATTISGNSNAQGTAATFANSDHKHQLTQAAATQDEVPQFDGSNWQAVNPETVFAPARAWRLSDDWISSLTSGELGWTAVLTGGASVVTVGSTGVDSNHPGVVVITAGNAAARFADLHLGPTSMILGGGAITLECLFNLQTLTNAAFRIGLGDTTAADHANGVYLEYNSGVSANWLIKTASASTRTSTTTSVAATANAWHRIVITINAAATSVSYTLDGVSLGSITTNIPTAAIAPNLMSDSLGATNSTMWVDYFIMYQRFTSAR